MYERVVIGFEKANWPPEAIIPAMVAIESFVLGSALDAVAPSTQLAAGPDAEHVPRFVAAVDARNRAALRSGRTAADLAFEIGLTALVSGLERQRLALSENKR